MSYATIRGTNEDGIGRIAFAPAVQEAAETIAALPSDAGQGSKRLLRGSEARALEAQLAEESSTLAVSASSESSLLELQAF